MWSLAKSWVVNLTNSLNCLPVGTLSQQSEDDLNMEGWGKAPPVQKPEFSKHFKESPKVWFIWPFSGHGGYLRRLFVFFGPLNICLWAAFYTVLALFAHGFKNTTMCSKSNLTPWVSSWRHTQWSCYRDIKTSHIKRPPAPLLCLMVKLVLKKTATSTITATIAINSPHCLRRFSII